jgi:chromosome segregation ATPase
MDCQGLRDNIERLTVACDELRDCLENLNEENDELVSANQMLKELKEQHLKLSQLQVFKTIFKVGIPPREEEKAQVWTQIVQDDIELPKSSRAARLDRPVVPKIKIPRPKIKKYS